MRHDTITGKAGKTMHGAMTNKLGKHWVTEVEHPGTSRRSRRANGQYKGFTKPSGSATKKAIAGLTRSILAGE